MKQKISVGLLFLLGLTMSWGEVAQDANLKTPSIDYDKDNNRERILLNFRVDGTVSGKDFKVLETDEAIKVYLAKSRDEITSQGKEPIQLPKEGGVRWLDRFIQPREQDLNMALPANDDASAAIYTPFCD